MTGREAINSPVGSPALMKRRFADVLLFSVTVAELTFLIQQTPTFGFVDWIYISQHLLVLTIAFARRTPVSCDHSLRSSIAVVASYAYPYLLVLWFGWYPGAELWPTLGEVLVIISACASLLSLVSLGRSFGIRPALRHLQTHGAYRVVRHPMYLSYFISDVGYTMQEWNVGAVLLVLAGWLALFYRIHAEERVLSRATGWSAYVAMVPYRLLPGVW
jgi:protein-S-isoprenylcysteine O-methyltransferase Ste14